MAERKAVNKYYPPDWSPSKGSLNTFLGQHPLRARARKLGQGILIVRFELPYNVFCEGCGKHIAQGVRYNAEKKKIGMYYSTPIFSFRMKCHLCTHWIEIHTDPQNTRYVVASGAKEKTETWDAKDNETIEIKDEEYQKALYENAFFKLEHDKYDVKKAEVTVPVLQQLQEYRDERYKDDYSQSSVLRKRFREEKKVLAAEAKEMESLQQKASLNIPILPLTEDDVIKSKRIKFAAPPNLLQNVKLLKSGSIFDQPRRKGKTTLKVPEKMYITKAHEFSQKMRNATQKEILSNAIKKA